MISNGVGLTTSFFLFLWYFVLALAGIVDSTVQVKNKGAFLNRVVFMGTRDDSI